MTNVEHPDLPLGSIAAQAAQDAGGIDVTLLGDFLEVLVAAVATGTRLGARDLVGYGAAGRAAAANGVALRAVVDLYLSAAWRLWSHLPEVVLAERNPAAVVRAGEVMLRGADDAVAELTEGYQLARRDLVRAQVAARRELVDDLLVGSARSMPGLMDRAALFGLSLTGPHAVVIVRADRPFTDSSPLTRILERSIQGSKADSDALVTTKDGALVVIFAAPDRTAIDQAIAGLTAGLPAQQATAARRATTAQQNTAAYKATAVQQPPTVQLRRTASVGSWRVGVGRAHTGPGGVRVSFEQAQEALDLGARLGGVASVLDAADLLVHRVLVRDEPAIRELVEAILTPLRRTRGGVEPLLLTLEAYFAAGGNASLAARSMHLSVRALTYRLAKIADLTGRDPADPASRYELQTAVLGARLLGWPGSHENSDF